MNIVITNDDGINAPGIKALAKAAASFGDVTVIAPEKNWSACGHYKTLGRPLRAVKADFPGGIPAWAIDGSPSDCTALAGLGFLEKKIDLVLSGINPTPNLGEDISYSGTVTAALESIFWEMKGAAFSLDCAGIDPKKIDFSGAEKAVKNVIRMVLTHEIPPHTILNVNIPYLPYEEMKGIRVGRCCERTYNDVLVRNIDPFGKPYYWFGGDPPSGSLVPGTDLCDMKTGFISVAPLHMDMTAYQRMKEVSDWNWEL